MNNGERAQASRLQLVRQAAAHLRVSDRDDVPTVVNLLWGNYIDAGTVRPANISSTKRTVDGGSFARPRDKSKARSASSVSRPKPPAPTMYVAVMSRRYPGRRLPTVGRLGRSEMTRAGCSR